MGDPEVIVIAVMLLAIVAAAVRAIRLPPGAPKALWTLVGSSLFAGLFCVVGAWNLIGIHAARRISATGTLIDLEEQQGGRSSDFEVVPASGQPFKVHCQYTGPNLHNGQLVLVDELTFHNTLLRLQVLEGLNAGWVLTEGDGTASSVAALVIGAALIFGARARWINYPEG